MTGVQTCALPIYSLITIKDNEDGEIEVNKDNVKVTTNLDTTKAGTYKVTYEVTDKDGNKTTLELQIVIEAKTEAEKYEELKVEAIKVIEDYKAKATEEELNNKKTNAEEKTVVIEAYNKLKDEDKTPYTEFINKVKQGGSPVITKVSNESLKYKEGTEIDLYSLITIKDNEDGEIKVNKDNVKVTTNLDTTKAGTYKVTYEVTDKDGNKTTLELQIVIEAKTEAEKYEELKVEAIKVIEDYKAKATEEELNNKKTNAEEKTVVIEAYNKLKDEDKTPYTEFINKVKQGGSPVITKVSNESLKYKEGTEIDLYSLITIKDNEDGEIKVNKDNVKVTTNLDTTKAGTYKVTYEVTDKDGNKTTLTILIEIEEKKNDSNNEDKDNSDENQGNNNNGGNNEDKDNSDENQGNNNNGGNNEDKDNSDENQGNNNNGSDNEDKDNSDENQENNNNGSNNVDKDDSNNPGNNNNSSNTEDKGSSDKKDANEDNNAQNSENNNNTSEANTSNGKQTGITIKQGTLPKTGKPKTILPIILCLLVIISSIILYVKKKKK